MEYLTEIGLRSTMKTNFRTQYTSEFFKQKFKNFGIEIIYSSLYHHQSNSDADRSIGIVKLLWKKEENTERRNIYLLDASYHTYRQQYSITVKNFLAETHFKCSLSPIEHFSTQTLNIIRI